MESFVYLDLVSEPSHLINGWAQILNTANCHGPQWRLCHTHGSKNGTQSHWLLIPLPFQLWHILGYHQHRTGSAEAEAVEVGSRWRWVNKNHGRMMDLKQQKDRDLADTDLRCPQIWLGHAAMDFPWQWLRGSSSNDPVSGASHPWSPQIVRETGKPFTRRLCLVAHFWVVRFFF